MFLEYFSQFVVYVESLDKFWAFWVLIFAKIVSGALLFPGTPLTLLSGVVLGKFWGTVAAVVGNVLGATAAFLWARYLFKNFVQNKILTKYPKINEYENKLAKNGFLTVVFLRLVPLFPFNALNPILGVTDIRFKDYFLGTLVGIIPGTFAFVYLGESFKMLSFWNILFAVLGIVGLGYIGKLWKLK
jgi:uncharacterized membrane protein YdjX (TVP38/TMEM64 family)